MNNNTVEIIANKATIAAQNNNRDTEIEALANLFNTVQNSSSQMLRISNYNLVGSAFLLMADHASFMNNEDIRRVIADNTFYCLSKAIEEDNTNGLLRMKRLMMMSVFHEDFYYTIANAMDIPDGGIGSFGGFGGMPLIVRTNDYYYGIIHYDLSKLKQEQINSVGVIQNLYRTLSQQGTKYNLEEGRGYINKIVKHLESIYSKY